MLQGGEAVLAATFYDLAAGKLTVEDLATWFRRWTKQVFDEDADVLAMADRIIDQDRHVLRELD